MVRDYSPHRQSAANGLDESFEIVVNGHVHTYPTNCGAPVYREENPLQMDWYDFELPKAEFVKGVNEIMHSKAPSDKNDDYVYLGIDESEVRGNSSVTFDGQTWLSHALTDSRRQRRVHGQAVPSGARYWPCVRRGGRVPRQLWTILRRSSSTPGRTRAHCPPRASRCHRPMRRASSANRNGLMRCGRSP